MLTALVISLLAQNPATMAGAPVGAVSGNSILDFTASLFLTAPLTAAQCANANITTDQGNAVTVTRASSSYCQRDDGAMVLISSGKPVVEAAGLRVESGSSNRVTYSEDLNTGWTKSNVTLFGSQTDPAGGTTAQQWDDSAVGGSLKSPTFTITGTSAVLSAWTYNEGGVNGTLVLRDTTASADRCTITITPGTVFALTMAGRPSCFSASITSGNNHQVWFFPGGSGGTGSGVSVWGVQVEPGISIKTSYMPTAGAVASRASDDVSITVADFNSQGCVSASVTFTTSTYQGGVMRWFNASGGSPLTSASSTSLSMHDNATSATLTVSDISNRTTTARSQWSGTSMFIVSGGVTGTAGTFDGTMGAGGVLTLGSAGGGSAAINGWIKAIKFSTDPKGCN